MDLIKHAKELFLKILTNFSPTQSSVDLKKEIYEYDKSYSLNLLNEESDYLISALKRNLRNHIESRKNKGSQAKFEFSTSDDDFIIGIANIYPKFSVFPDFYRYMKSMSDGDFEKFSANYIKMHFSDFSFVTRRSGDGGIDFIGSGTFKKLQNFAGTFVDLKNKNIGFRIVGQSKRYDPKNPIGPKEIREFLGSVRILQEAANPNKVNAWLGETKVLNMIKLAEPFIYIFLTTSYYSDDACDLSDKLGIYIYDIDDLIFDLIEEDIGITKNKFDVVLFEKWCRK